MPFKLERITSWPEYVEKVVNPPYRHWAFRGHSDARWKLMSTLGRYLAEYIDRKRWKSQEARSLRVFRRKAHLFLTHVPEPNDTFQWLALMQHHGAPTRLLDFTWSPYVAAFFALERAAETAAVWALNPSRLTNVTERLNPFLSGKLRGQVGIGEPFVMNRRLIAQSGTFVVTRQAAPAIEELVVEEPEDTLVKFELPATLVRGPGMRELFNMNLSAATLFPDLDGLARSMAYELEFHWAYEPGKPLRQPGS